MEIGSLGLAWCLLQWVSGSSAFRIRIEGDPAEPLGIPLVCLSGPDLIRVVDLVSTDSQVRTEECKVATLK